MFIKRNSGQTGSFRTKKPGTPGYGMKADAARMAAEAAPIVPATNTRIQTKKPAASPYPPTAPTAPTGQSGIMNTGAAPLSAEDRAKDKMREAASAAAGEVKAEREAPINAAVAASKGALQQSQADLMARMGAAGFGSSGAAASLTGNLQSQAARELANEINNITLRQKADARAERGLEHQIDTDDRRLDADEAARQAELDSQTIAAGGFVDRDGNGFQDHQPTGVNLTEEQWYAGQDLRTQTTRQHYGDLDLGAGIHAMGDKNGGVNNPYILYKSEDPTAAGLVYVGAGPRGYKMFKDPVTGDYYIIDPR
jgi:hypothetical protein